MGCVVAFAVGIAALPDANGYWAVGLLLATPPLFGVSLKASVCSDDRSRARRVAVAV
jgi:hypothetical protein